MLPAEGIYMAPATQHIRKGKAQRIDIMAAVRRERSQLNLTAVAEAARQSKQPSPQPEEPSMTLELEKLEPRTLSALAHDTAVPEEMRKLAQSVLSARTDASDLVDGDKEAIAASHRSGGFSAWVERQVAT